MESIGGSKFHVRFFLVLFLHDGNEVLEAVDHAKSNSESNSETSDLNTSGQFGTIPRVF